MIAKRKDLIHALEQLKIIFHDVSFELSGLTDDDDVERAMAHKYPFNESFNETTMIVDEWVRELTTALYELEEKTNGARTK